MPHDRRDLLEKIKAFLPYAQQRAVDAFEVGAHVESGFTATARMGSAENLEHHREVSFSIAVYHQQRTGSVAVSDLSLLALQQSFDKACAIAQHTGADDCAGLAQKSLMAYDYPDLSLYHPWQITPKAAIELALVADQAARDADERITRVDEASVVSSQSHHVYANSHGFVGDYSATTHGMSVSVVAQAQQLMERDVDYCYARRASDLDAPEVIADAAVARTLRRLQARKIPTCRCPVIFERRVAKSLWGHFIAAISGSQLYRKTSFLVDSLGQKIFPDFLTLGQQPHLLCGYGSVPFDHQGVKTQDLKYVEQGRVSHYVLGNYSAKKLGMTTTGNAGGVFNLSVTHTDKDMSALCQEIGTGLLVTELLGQGVNLMTGDYSRGAAGFWIDQGEIQYPVHEVTIAGNLRDMFAQVVAVGNDLDRRANIVTGSVLIEQMMVAGS